mmetsp:Transcript_10503/g.15658  ORF Transcript_10503/g.15658 Transcript_10503/m.15658 type:complete len:246 (+) Transcript_10503:135-872(+)
MHIHMHRLDHVSILRKTFFVPPAFLFIPPVPHRYIALAGTWQTSAPAGGPSPASARCCSFSNRNSRGPGGIPSPPQGHCTLFYFQPLVPPERRRSRRAGPGRRRRGWGSRWRRPRTRRSTGTPRRAQTGRTCRPHGPLQRGSPRPGRRWACTGCARSRRRWAGTRPRSSRPSGSTPRRTGTAAGPPACGTRRTSRTRGCRRRGRRSRTRPRSSPRTGGTPRRSSTRPRPAWRAAHSPRCHTRVRS